MRVVAWGRFGDRRWQFVVFFGTCRRLVEEREAAIAWAIVCKEVGHARGFDLRDGSFFGGLRGSTPWFAIEIHAFSGGHIVVVDVVRIGIIFGGFGAFAS